MKTKLYVFTAFLCFISCFVLSGQPGSKNQADANGTDPKSSVNYVYLQTDRSYYLPGETIFFTSYFMDDLCNRTFPGNDTLNITILDQDGLEVASVGYPVNNNIISGEVFLPDVLAEGNYLMFASTRAMLNLSPERIFSKIIEIRKSLNNYLITDLSLGASVYGPGESLIAQLRFSGKDNKPVPASFSYQLLGKDEEILNGNNKANADGFASLKFQLPKFDSKEILKLIVVPSYKGAKNITGVFIPTRFNTSVSKANQVLSPSSSESKHLNIQLKTIYLSNGKNDKVQLEISVTDETGKPIMVNMTVSASNIMPHQLSFENDNILNYSDLKQLQAFTGPTPDLKDYFTQYLIQKTQAPGHPFIVQGKNNAKKLKKNKEFIKNEEKTAASKSSTLFWGPQVMTDNAGKASVSFFNNENSNEVIISVNGMSANGICGSSSLRYTVK